MALRVSTTGNVLLRDIGTDGVQKVDTTASVAVKRKFGDTTYSLRATESTIKNMRSLNGALVQISKPLGNNVTSNLKWDLGGRNVILGLLKVIKFSQGRSLELGAGYSDKTQLLTLEAAGRPHKDHRLAASLVPQTNAVLASYTMNMNGMTSTVAHNFAKDTTVLTAVKKLPGGQAVKASYGLSDKAALVELAQAPFTLSLRTKLQRNHKPGRPTLGLTISRDVEYREVMPRKAQPPKQPAVPAKKITINPTTDMTLDDKLKALDIMHSKAFAEKGKLKEGGVEVATYTRN